MLWCFGVGILCLAIVPGSFCNEDIHKYMSREEVQQVFHTDHDSVPKYEIVKLHFSERLHKRDLQEGSKMHIRAFGEDINLWLHPTKPILAGEETPVYYARYSADKPEGVEYRRRDGLMGMVGRIFEDPDNLAFLVIGTDVSGRTRANGYIESKRLAVKSLPPRVAEEYSRRRRSVGDTDDSDSPFHVVFDNVETFEGYYPVTSVNETELRFRASQYVSGIPDTLYPEILVVVEYSLYRTYGRDIYGLLQYLLAFWNGVDLKYRSLESPKVRLHISGIVLAEDPRATPYISRNSLGDDAFNSSAAMSNVGEFYYAVRDSLPQDSYDIAVTMTRQAFGIESGSGILGMAWIGTACKHFDGYYSSLSVTLVKDNGAFGGILVAAHELGHLLGAPHDNNGDNCKYSNGFIMSFTPWYTKNSSDFSSCSTEKFDLHLKANYLDCLFNRPENPGKILPELMPGRMKNLQEQCEAMGYESPCESDHSDVCVNIYCRDSNGECRETGNAAMDGTSCEGNDKFCLHMRCVSL